jgi:protein phosphatase
VASRLAIETIDATYLDPSVDELTDAIAQANHRIFTAANDDATLHGMGTTTVAIALLPPEDDDEGTASPQLMVVNVGDSRAYLFRDGELTQITDDHSVVAEMVRDGRITAEEAEEHPQRNIITRVLGVYPEVTPDLWPVDAVRGDRFLLCSDGLFNEVGPDRMGAVLRRLDDPTEAAAELVRLANEGGGRDNVTVIVVDVVDDGGVAESASRAIGHEPTASSRQSSTDLAGFAQPLPTESSPYKGPSASARRKEQRREARTAEGGRSRVTWRVVLFGLLVLGVLGGAVATVQWYGTSTYYVGFHDDEVAIYQGRPGGLLWIEPSLEQDTGIGRDEVPARYTAALEAGHQHSSLAEANQYVSNIERDIIERTTTTTTTTSTTVVPAAPTTAPAVTAAN